jgi:hypothetical protein
MAWMTAKGATIEHVACMAFHGEDLLSLCSRCVAKVAPLHTWDLTTAGPVARKCDKCHAEIQQGTEDLVVPAEWGQPRLEASIDMLFRRGKG